MVYTLKDIKHLETIANLQDKEVEQPKPIFAQVEDTSLTATLLKLRNKLRAEGYNKYAESIENKFVNYKTAGVHLYQAHKETGEDLIDQAHPDGDNKIVSDVSDNNGDVETIVSKHKKIVDVVNKQPTGKLASYVQQCKIALGSCASPLVSKEDLKVSLGQENTAANIGEGIGGAVVFSGGIAGLKWLFSKLTASKSLDAQTIKNIQQALGRKLTNEEANIITKKIVKRVGQNIMKKVFGDGMTQTISKEVGDVATKAIADVGATAGETAAGGAGGSISGFFGMAVPALTSVLSIVGAAIVGGVVGYKIFQDKFYATNLKKAGDNLLSEYNDVKEGGNIGLKSEADAFNKYLQNAIVSSQTASTIAENATTENLQALKNYIDNLQEASQHAYKMMTIARETYEKQGSWLGGMFSGYRDIEISASNFINITQKPISEARSALNQIKIIVQNQKGGSQVAEQLIHGYENAAKKIQLFIDRVKVTKPQNTADIINWLNDTSGKLEEAKKEFSTNRNKEDE